MTKQSQNIIVVTGGETYLGYNLALRFLEEMDNGRVSRNWKLRVLAINKEGLERLERRGAEIHVVRYEDQDNLRQHLKQVNLVVLALNDRDQRAQDARNVIEVANQENVQSIQLFSHMGCDRATNNMRGLLDYHEVEEDLKNRYHEGKWVIIRLNFIQQFFYLWSPMIEDIGRLRMNVNEDSKFAPVNMVDLLDATVKIAKRSSTMAEFGVDDHYNQKTLQFTSGQSISGKEMANELTHALEGTPIPFERISVDEMRQYFEKIRDNSAYQPSPESQAKHDKGHLIPDRKYLSNHMISSIVSYLELARENQVSQTTQDIRKINGNDPINLKNFFKENRDQFRNR